MGILFRGYIQVLIFIFAVGSVSAHAQTCLRLFNINSQNSIHKTLKKNNQLKIANWNLLNLRIEKQEVWEKEHRQRRSSDISNKRADDLKKIQNALKDIDADIYIFEEVVGLKSLKNLIQNEMGGNFDAYLIKGNDERGIDVGFAIRKSLNVEVQIESNKNLRWVDENGRTRPAFVRDLPILFLREKDDSNLSPKDSPDLIVLGTHYKAKRTDNDGDFEANNYRTEHAEKTVEIVSQLQKKYPNVPIVLGGDFNTDVSTAPELNSLRQSMGESLALMGDQLTPEEKITHTFHPKIQENNKVSVDGQVVAAQLDGLFVNQSMAKRLLKAFVYHYKNIFGQIKKYSKKLYPQSLKERKENPSDHMPVVAIYDMTRP